MVLSELARRLERSWPLRHAFFMLAALGSILIVGYSVGGFDQSIHLPFLKTAADPTLFPGDGFIDLRYSHYSFFWYLFLPFYRLGVLEISMFVAHVIATYLTFGALWQLGKTLFGNPLAAMLCVLAFIFPHISFAGFPVIEFSLLNRTFVLPFLLLSINLFLRERYRAAFLLLGVMYNLHVLSVNFVLVMFLFDFVLEIRKVGWRNILSSVGMFLAAAAPVLIWKMGDAPVDLSLRPEWFSIVANGFLYHVFYLFGPDYVPAITLSALCAVAAFFIGRRAEPSAPRHRTVLILVGAVFGIVLAGSVASLWLPVTIIIQMQILRAGIFAVIFGYLYFAGYLARCFQEERFPAADWGILLAAFLLFPMPLPAILILLALKLWRFSRKGRTAVSIALASVFVVCVGVAWNFHIWQPGIFIFAQQTPWYEAQRWAQQHTPKDAVFITPPEKWWLYEPDWRVYSERRTVVTLSELLEAAFAPGYISGWEERFADLAPGALQHFQGNLYENQRWTRQAFATLSTRTLVECACEYGATYLVVEKPAQHLLPQVYENAQYRIYQFDLAACSSKTPIQTARPAR